MEAQNPTASWPTPTEGTFEIENFQFASGDTLPKLRLHYRTVGKLRQDATCRTNAVLVQHGTGGAGTQFFRDVFAGELFNPGQLLDAEKYFIILPDGIGHGGSSKPSDGLRAKFPRYGYNDMIRAAYTLVTEGLGVKHLRLVMGTSMGGMHSWIWGEMFPDFMDALMPLASLPVQIAGRNRMTRKMIIDAIRSDPEYRNGDYEKQPIHGLTTALYVLSWMSSVPLQWQKEAPTREEADAFLDRFIAASLEGRDANDLIYQVDASWDYDPSPLLENIKAPLHAINSADDQVNPPELGILEEKIKKVPLGRATVLPISDATRGHGSHTYAVLWKDYLRKLLEETGGLL